MDIISRLLNMWKATTDKKDDDALRIGILGAAAIAPHALIYPASKLTTCIVYAIAARDSKKAEKFAKSYKIPKVFQSYEELIRSEEVDIIYNPLPNGYHAYYTILALKTGKHIICEKPLASNEKEVVAIRKALENAPINPRTKSKPLLIEALHCRFHPLHQRIRQMVASDDIGDIISINSRFILPFLAIGKSDIRYNANGSNPELAGGSLMDCGCYAVNVMREFVEKDLDQPSFEVIEASMANAFAEKSGSEAVDSRTHAKIRFSPRNEGAKGIEAEITCSFKGIGISPTVHVIGTKQEIYIYNFVVPFIYHYVVVKDLKTGRKTTIKEYGEGNTTYFYQLKAFVDAVQGNEDAVELCKWAGGIDSAARNMKIIDAIYEKAGFSARKGMEINPTS